MPRPQLGVGEYGNVNTTKQGGVWVSLARYRDTDGVTRRVKAQGKSKGAAEAALRTKLKDRDKSGQGITSESRVSELAEAYYAAKVAAGMAPSTVYNLRRNLDNHVVPKLGGLRIREATAPRIAECVAVVVAENGPGTAVNVRSDLSGMFALAARWGAVPGNPVQHTPVPKTGGKPVRALTPQDLIRMRTHAVEFLRPLTTEERLARAGGDRSRMGGMDRGTLLLDLIDFMLATGARAGEGPGLAKVDVHLDDEVPWVHIRQQAVRVIGEGMRLTPTKERDERRLRLPGFGVAMLRRRLASVPGPMVFPSRWGSLLDTRRVGDVWRTTFRGTEWDWVTPKTLRKTVATLVDAELGSKAAAKQLGHASDAVTLRHYVAPSLVPVDSGEVLELHEVYGPETGRLEILPSPGAEAG